MIYPPIEIAKWQTTLDQEPTRRYGLVNVSRFHQDKKHEVMLEIVKGFSMTLTLIGNSVNEVDKLYLKELRRKAPSNVRFLENIEEEQIHQELRRAKVYLNSSHETFGISTVEAIAAGCVPVVPNHSGHKETVPFPELRYDSISQARNIIQDALLEKFDYLLPKLQSHIRQFDEPNFQSKMMNVIHIMLNA
jgi:glycosyltransferase involved in cell wall biosynthesis